MEATKVIISEIEKTHNCVIVNNMQPEKMSEKTKDPTGCATAVADGGTTVGPSGKSTMNLNYNSIFSVNDKEVKMISGHRITIVVGDLAHQQVYLEYLIGFHSCNMKLITISLQNTFNKSIKHCRSSLGFLL